MSGELNTVSGDLDLEVISEQNSSCYHTTKLKFFSISYLRTFMRKFSCR